MVSPIARCLVLAISVAAGCYEARAISSLANNDPYPMYSSVYDPYLTTWRKQWIKGDPNNCFCCEHIAFAVSPFYQKARSGRTFAHARAFLGDLQGPWNMLALLYGPLPAGANLNGTQLGFAKINIFSDFFASQPGVPDQNTIFSDENPATKPYLLFDDTFEKGYFSVPIHYRKVGARFELSVQPWEDFGLTVQGGVSEIRQTVTTFIDRAVEAGFSCPATLSGVGSFVTCPDEFCDAIPILLVDATTAPFYTTCDELNPMETGTVCTTPFCQVERQLMDLGRAKTIFRQLGLDDCNFEETSLEDIRFILWWRHIFNVNEGRDECIWPAFLIIPSLEFHAIAPSAKKRNRRKLFALPFGNDGHVAIGADVGLAMDFIETVEIAFKAGITYFAPRDVSDYRVPTDVRQSGIFPFATDVHLRPGLNFNFNAILSAYHFYYNFSAFAEYVMVKHEQDKISLINPDPAFNVPLAECITKFVSHMVNGAINYDISPNITLGILGQFPIGQRNAYRSTTWLGTFRVVF